MKSSAKPKSIAPKNSSTIALPTEKNIAELRALNDTNKIIEWLNTEAIKKYHSSLIHWVDEKLKADINNNIMSLTTEQLNHLTVYIFELIQAIETGINATTNAILVQINENTPQIRDSLTNQVNTLYNLTFNLIHQYTKFIPAAQINPAYPKKYLERYAYHYTEELNLFGMMIEDRQPSELLSYCMFYAKIFTKQCKALNYLFAIKERSQTATSTDLAIIQKRIDIVIISLETSRSILEKLNERAITEKNKNKKPIKDQLNSLNKEFAILHLISILKNNVTSELSNTKFIQSLLYKLCGFNQTDQTPETFITKLREVLNAELIKKHSILTEALKVKNLDSKNLDQKSIQNTGETYKHEEAVASITAVIQFINKEYAAASENTNASSSSSAAATENNLTPAAKKRGRPVKNEPALAEQNTDEKAQHLKAAALPTTQNSDDETPAPLLKKPKKTAKKSTPAAAAAMDFDEQNRQQTLTEHLDEKVTLSIYQHCNKLARMAKKDLNDLHELIQFVKNIHPSALITKLDANLLPADDKAQAGHTFLSFATAFNSANSKIIVEEFIKKIKKQRNDFLPTLQEPITDSNNAYVGCNLLAISILKKNQSLTVALLSMGVTLICSSTLFPTCESVIGSNLARNLSPELLEKLFDTTAAAALSNSAGGASSSSSAAAQATYVAAASSSSAAASSASTTQPTKPLTLNIPPTPKASTPSHIPSGLSTEDEDLLIQAAKAENLSIQAFLEDQNLTAAEFIQKKKTILQKKKEEKAKEATMAAKRNSEDENVSLTPAADNLLKKIIIYKKIASLINEPIESVNTEPYFDPVKLTNGEIVERNVILKAWLIDEKSARRSVKTSLVAKERVFETILIPCKITLELLKLLGHQHAIPPAEPIPNQKDYNDEKDPHSILQNKLQNTVVLLDTEHQKEKANFAFYKLLQTVAAKLPESEHKHIKFKKDKITHPVVRQQLLIEFEKLLTAFRISEAAQKIPLTDEIKEGKTLADLLQIFTLNNNLISKLNFQDGIKALQRSNHFHIMERLLNKFLIRVLALIKDPNTKELFDDPIFKLDGTVSNRTELEIAARPCHATRKLIMIAVSIADIEEHSAWKSIFTSRPLKSLAQPQLPNKISKQQFKEIRDLFITKDFNATDFELRLASKFYFAPFNILDYQNGITSTSLIHSIYLICQQQANTLAAFERITKNTKPGVKSLPANTGRPLSNQQNNSSQSTALLSAARMADSADNSSIDMKSPMALVTAQSAMIANATPTARISITIADSDNDDSSNEEDLVNEAMEEVINDSDLIDESTARDSKEIAADQAASASSSASAAAATTIAAASTSAAAASESTAAAAATAHPNYHSTQPLTRQQEDGEDAAAKIIAGSVPPLKYKDLSNLYYQFGQIHECAANSYHCFDLNIIEATTLLKNNLKNPTIALFTRSHLHVTYPTLISIPDTLSDKLRTPRARNPHYRNNFTPEFAEAYFDHEDFKKCTPSLYILKALALIQEKNVVFYQNNLTSSGSGSGQLEFKDEYIANKAKSFLFICEKMSANAQKSYDRIYLLNSTRLRRMHKLPPQADKPANYYVASVSNSKNSSDVKMLAVSQQKSSSSSSAAAAAAALPSNSNSLISHNLLRSAAAASSSTPSLNYQPYPYPAASASYPVNSHLAAAASDLSANLTQNRTSALFGNDPSYPLNGYPPGSAPNWSPDPTRNLVQSRFPTHMLDHSNSSYPLNGYTPNNLNHDPADIYSDRNFSLSTSAGNQLTALENPTIPNVNQLPDYLHEYMPNRRPHNFGQDLDADFLLDDNELPASSDASSSTAAASATAVNTSTNANIDSNLAPHRFLIATIPWSTSSISTPTSLSFFGQAPAAAAANTNPSNATALPSAPTNK